jgi:hypothetical protein
MDERIVQETMSEYQRNAPAGWTWQDVSARLQDWADLFRSHFKLEIPSVPLRLARLRWNCLGHFNPGFNDFGLPNEIGIDEVHLFRRITEGNWWQVLGTELHEQLHFWQQLHGKPAKPGPGNYHNVQYRAKARECGLIVSQRGVTEGYVEDGPFLQLLRERGVEVPQVLPAPAPRGRGASTLRKWVCCCTPPVSLRVGRSRIRVQCLDCGAQFVTAD